MAATDIYGSAEFGIKDLIVWHNLDLQLRLRSMAAAQLGIKDLIICCGLDLLPQQHLDLDLTY